MLIYYRVEGRIMHRPCLYMYAINLVVDMESYSKSLNRKIIVDKGAV